jgi:formate transporter
MDNHFSIDALLPAEMAVKAENAGVAKANLGFFRMLTLSILAGAFIGMGAIFATTITTGASGMLPFGVTRFLAGFAFCLGLILVVGAGAELFTGNNLIVMAWADRKVTTGQVLRNWGIVYLGNFIGSVATAVGMF